MKRTSSAVTPKKSETPKKSHVPANESESGAAQSHNIEYEFGGPYGALAVVLFLPVLVYALFFLCNKDVCLESPMQFDWKGWTEKNLPSSIFDFFSYEATIIYLGWMIYHIAMERVLPGEEAEGTVLPNGKKLSYTLSGHLQFWITIVLMGHAMPLITEITPNSMVYAIRGFSPLKLSLLYDHYVPLITASTIGAFLLSFYLYISSFKGDKILAKGGNTGSAVYDFFIGRELNPRIGTLDLKEFCELRPGLIGWLVLNMGMACKQYGNRMALSATRSGSISMSMFLITLFQGVYVWDALYAEKAILTTMDITTDGFGFMLAFGDLTWVPFIYSLQARYLVDHDPALNLWQVAAVATLHFLGFYIFRSANSQKDSFRRDPNSAEMSKMTFLQTKRGTKLLTSGWWGLARKINYTGDWLVTLSWCLLCGFKSPVPYFQAVYFLILLVHRAIRDDHMCSEKYGTDWIAYKKAVPYMFIPYVI